MKQFIALLLAAVLAAGCACALAAGSVKATGSVNLRTGPGLDFDKQTAVHKNTVLEYLGETSTDERGVDWYKVEYEGAALWISSRYSELTEAEAAPDEEPEANVAVTAVPDLGGEDCVELSGYYMVNLAEAAAALGLTDYAESEQSEARCRWFSDVLLISGNELVENFELTGAGYSVFGVTTGMHVDAARALLTAAGLTQINGIGVCFAHPAGKNSPVNVDGADSCVNIVADVDGIITEISWNSYTG